MPKEQGQTSLIGLRESEAKLQKSLAKADFVELTFSSSRYVNRLENAIEKTPEKVMSRYTGQLVRPQEARQEADLRVFDIKEAITRKATPKIESSLASVQAHIRLLDETPRLISLWKDYQDERTGAENYVTRIEERVSAGLDPSALERAKARLSEVEDRVKNEQELVRAKEAYMASLQGEQKNLTVSTDIEPEVKQPPKEQLGLPSIKIDRSASTIQVNDGEPTKLTKIQMAVLVKLAKNLEEQIKSRELSRILRNAGSQTGTGAIVFINVLREKLGDSVEDPKIITMEHSKSNAKYQLRVGSVEFVGKPERSNIAKESTKLFEITLPDNKTIEIRGKVFKETLEALIQTSEENPIQTDDLCRKVYGKFDREYRKRVVAVIHELRDKISPHNYRILQSVNPSERTKGQLGKYYLKTIEPKDAETQVVTLPSTPPIELSVEKKDLIVPTDEEMLLFVTQAKRRGKLFKSYGLQPLPAEITQAWVRPATFRRDANKRSKEQINALKLSVYEKLVNIINNDEIYTVPEQFSERTRRIIEYFIDLKRDDKLELLKNVIFEENGLHYKVDRYGQADLITSGAKQETASKTEKPTPEVSPTSSEQITHLTDGIKTHKDSDIAAGGTTVSIPQSPEQSTDLGKVEDMKGKKLDLEQRFPGLAETVVQILNEIEPHLTSNTKKLTVPQISRVFQVKAKFINNKINNGYVTGEKGRDHHPIFGEDQIAMLVFLKRNGNGLSPAEVKALKKIIASEVKKRQESQKTTK